MRPADTRHDKRIAKLYQGGFSASDIVSRLNIPLHRVYDALVRQHIARRSPWAQNLIRFERSPRSFTFKKRLSLPEQQLMIAGLMLYYGEGAKTGTTVDFANSDPLASALFIRFLRVICGIEEGRLRLYLYCFSNQDTDALIRFWSSRLGVERARFTRPYVRSTLNRGNRTMTYGVIHIRYSDKRLLEELLSRISATTSSLIQ